ncbi:MAG TPA: hypothetical protein VH518_22535 [Tepidisphaeraceae bacterium]
MNRSELRQSLHEQLPQLRVLRKNLIIGDRLACAAAAKNIPKDRFGEDEILFVQRHDARAPNC